MYTFLRIVHYNMKYFEYIVSFQRYLMHLF
jgi:hypothetical protein